MESWLEAGKVSQAAEGWITGRPHHAWLKDVCLEFMYMRSGLIPVSNAGFCQM